MTAGVTQPGLSKGEYAELAERFVALRRRFEVVLGAFDSEAHVADAVAAALGANLTTMKAAHLPLAALTIWRDRVLRPLKADTTKPLPARAVASIRSWPASRIVDLRVALVEIHAILADAENDARNEVIYAEISRAYS
jgi:hypothetical protein